MPKINQMTARPGNAPVVRQGQTADNADGVYPDAPIVGRPTEARDLEP